MRSTLVRVVLADVAAARPQLSGPALAAARILSEDWPGDVPRRASSGPSGRGPRRLDLPRRSVVAGVLLTVAAVAAAGATVQHLTAEPSTSATQRRPRQTTTAPAEMAAQPLAPARRSTTRPVAPDLCGLAPPSAGTVTKP